MPPALPQELIDEIIGTFDLSEQYDPQIARTLKSCALVARSFVRQSQACLFAYISAWDYEVNASRQLLGDDSETLIYYPYYIRKN
ncbi:hypothetical protein B0H12DRAFT_1160856 [Mycena haematopus]|nr:hypothetical protein B0H12DRAFT_1160856 [Mycena haematopus]